MAKARGSIEHRRRLAALPFTVECAIPPGGLMRRLDDMHARAQRACGNDRYATTTRTERRADRMPTEILRVHFADETTAQAFACEFRLDSLKTET
jgi:hypothetical protein